MNDEPPVIHVDYVCPRCWMALKPGFTRDDVVTWVDGQTRHYAHAECYSVTEEEGGLDNGGTMVATD